MVNKLRGTVTKGDSENRRGWRVLRSGERRSNPSGDGLTSHQKRGHLRLLKRAVIPTGARGHEVSLPQEFPESVQTGGERMSRRQQGKRAFKDDDGGVDESAGLDTSADIPNIKTEFILTSSADDTLQDAVRLFSRATGTNLTRSHFFRVLLKAVAHAMPELEKEASHVGRLKRPSNARDGQAAREEYERTLAAAVVAALRTAPPLDASVGERRKGRGAGKRSA